ncbi:hypothetical protein DP56_5968 [Burkholderia pseudomallei]|nr:hypothetical protein DP56_5968 [Burkholderia pseudomallei]
MDRNAIWAIDGSSFGLRLRLWVLNVAIGRRCRRRCSAHGIRCLERVMNLYE